MKVLMKLKGYPEQKGMWVCGINDTTAGFTAFGRGDKTAAIHVTDYQLEKIKETYGNKFDIVTYLNHA